MENSPKKSALDSMNELYTWLTAWDKDVNKQVRKRDEDTTEDKPRKKVSIKNNTKFQA